MRGNCVVDPVLSPYYEYVSSWEEVVGALRVAEMQREHDLPADIGVHVGLGLEIYDNAFGAPHGVLRPPRAGERYRGRHWTWQVAEHDSDTLIFLNTWGRGWGAGGWGYIPRDFFEAHVDCAIVQRPVYTGSSPAMDQALYEALWRRGRPGGFDPAEWVKQWQVPNPSLVGELEINGALYERWRRVVFSFTDGWPAAHVYDVVDGQQQLIGRFHLIDSRTDEEAVLQELWVVPERRRQGFGSALLAEAGRLARDLKNDRLVVPVFEADGGEDGLARAREFLEACGYCFEEYQTRRPNLPAAGSITFIRGDDANAHD